MSTLYIPPMFQTVLTPMTELVTTGCTMCTIDSGFTSADFKMGQRTVEVEARLGKIGAGGFTSGVTPAMFDLVVNKLDSFKGWVFSSPSWETVHDYEYQMDGHTIRTRKVFIQDEPVEHVIKKRLKNVDVVLSGNRNSLLDTVDIRGSLSVEQHIVFPEGVTVTPSKVTHKLQKRYQYKNWLFVVSKSKRHNHDVPCLEVEVEALKLDGAIGKFDMQQYIALGLLMKLTDFYPVFDSPYMLLPHHSR